MSKCAVSCLSTIYCITAAAALRNEQLLADYERMQQQQQQQQGFLEDESGPCGSTSTCWGPDDLLPPGAIPPGGIEKVGWAAWRVLGFLRDRNPSFPNSSFSGLMGFS